MAVALFTRQNRIFSALRISNRTFMMSSAKKRSEKVLEELKEKNPYFEKYGTKIAALQQKSPEELLSRLERAEKEKRKPKFGPSEGRDYTELMSPKPFMPGASKKAADGSKKLSDILKLELFENKTPDEIKYIWLEYHKTKDVVSAVLDLAQYDELIARGRIYPTFIFPIPRNQGYEFIVHQFSGNSIHFTPLLCYQVHKENAPECLNVTHYMDFKDKGIILMRGEYDTNVLSPHEAQCLVNQLQMYYCKGDNAKEELLKLFTNTPDKFKHIDVIRELENIKIE